MGVKNRGVNNVEANLNAFAENMINRKAPRAMHSALLAGETQAAVYAPISTSNFINPQYREVFSHDGKTTGYVGYSADEAIDAHDPATQQKSKEKFLTEGTEKVHEQIIAAIKQGLSV